MQSDVLANPLIYQIIKKLLENLAKRTTKIIVTENLQKRLLDQGVLGKASKTNLD
jgi:hypothetical protein